jgi:hypothetical protein
MSATLPAVGVLSGYRRIGAISVAVGGALIAIGWLLPWGSAGGSDVSGLSENLQWWFRYAVLGSGFLALSAGVLAGRPQSSWLIAIATVVAVGWSLIFPAVVYVGSRASVGSADIPASTGPTVSHGLGAYLLSVGVVAVALGSGPAGTSRRSIWIATAVLAAVVGLPLLIGLL